MPMPLSSHTRSNGIGSPRKPTCTAALIAPAAVEWFAFRRQDPPIAAPRGTVEALDRLDEVFVHLLHRHTMSRGDGLVQQPTRGCCRGPLGGPRLPVVRVCVEPPLGHTGARCDGLRAVHRPAPEVRLTSRVPPRYAVRFSVPCRDRFSLVPPALLPALSRSTRCRDVARVRRGRDR